MLAESELSGEQRIALMAGVRYMASPYHKTHPADYGMADPPRPRPDKSRCDASRVIAFEEALCLLRSGIERGMVNSQFRDGWPQNIWSVEDGGMVFEAQLHNAWAGEYHGYPLVEDDGFVGFLRQEWERRRQ